ncbi:hypothetical protein F183_A27000 [Bryobacterales bacterium F-183]|nr:hypothetical protein F183_A27000 [Bryobacterales bacterium F-183]
MFHLIAAAAFLTQAAPPSPVIQIDLAGVPKEGPRPALELVLPNGQKVANPDPATYVANLPGKYRLSGVAFRQPGKIVDTIMEAAPVERTVKAGEKVTLRLSYAARPTSGMLWIATARIDPDADDFSKGQLRAISEAKLAAGGFTNGDKIITTGPRLLGGAVDAQGNYYFGDGWNTNALMRLSPSGQGTPSKVTGTIPNGFCLDPDGVTVWQVDGRTLVRYNLKDGSLKAKIEVTEDEEEGLGTGMLFLPGGDLLLYRRQLLAVIPAAKLKTSGKLTRADATALTKFDSGALWQAAIDKNGGFWVADENNMVIHVPADAIRKGGTVNAREYPTPEGVVALAIDNEGGVWAMQKLYGEVYYLAPGASAFEKKGVFGKGQDEFTRLVFHPAPEWSPLSQLPGMPKRLTPAQ